MCAVRELHPVICRPDDCLPKCSHRTFQATHNLQFELQNYRADKSCLLLPPLSNAAISLTYAFSRSRYSTTHILEFTYRIAFAYRPICRANAVSPYPFRNSHNPDAAGLILSNILASTNDSLCSYSISRYRRFRVRYFSRTGLGLYASRFGLLTGSLWPSQLRGVAVRACPCRVYAADHSRRIPQTCREVAR